MTSVKVSQDDFIFSPCPLMGSKPYWLCIKLSSTRLNHHRGHSYQVFYMLPAKMAANQAELDKVMCATKNAILHSKISCLLKSHAT